MVVQRITEARPRPDVFGHRLRSDRPAGRVSFHAAESRQHYVTGAVWILIVFLLLAVPADAQSLASSSHRTAADVASWVTAGTLVALDTAEAWQAEDRSRALQREGLRLGVTYGAVYLAKWLVKRERPCAPSCGIDNPRFSFFSAHTAVSFSTVGGPRVAIAIPLAIGTGSGRVLSAKHHVSDVIVGAGVGLLTSRIR